MKIHSCFYRFHNWPHFCKERSHFFSYFTRLLIVKRSRTCNFWSTFKYAWILFLVNELKSWCAGSSCAVEVSTEFYSSSHDGPMVNIMWMTMDTTVIVYARMRQHDAHSEHTFEKIRTNFLLKICTISVQVKYGRIYSKFYCLLTFCNILSCWVNLQKWCRAEWTVFHWNLVIVALWHFWYSKSTDEWKSKTRL